MLRGVSEDRRDIDEDRRGACDDRRGVCEDRRGAWQGLRVVDDDPRGGCAVLHVPQHQDIETCDEDIWTDDEGDGVYGRVRVSQRTTLRANCLLPVPGTFIPMMPTRSPL
jgi:hypothetical protein